ncbi:MAG: hypothetical protein A3J79_09525 [Elusimicrobia bacterium RIFOXYB2_FULL_62_6]|nr:MAG: hypothetical protein A3J79_09525 [Elusimicrobia bacterium RIFOXYB2_FULL_62_6]
MEFSVKHLSAAVLAAALAAPVAAGQPAIDFDRGADMGAIMESVQESAKAADWSFAAVGSSLYSSRDCQLISFKAGDPLQSKPVKLVSQVYHQVCEQYQGQSYCHDELLRTVKRDVSVSLLGARKTLPWERDVFNVCLQDTVVDAEVVEASHKYKLGKKAGQDDCVIEATAKGKITNEPDADGISVGAWGLSGGSFELKLNDKWGTAYAADKAEMTLVRVTLKMEKANWFDPVLVEKEFVLDPAEVYTVDFSKYAAEFNHKLEFGQKYFVKWGFRREGSLSKSTFIHGGETERVFLPLP